MWRTLTSVCLAALMLVSCSVKQDRIDCPCTFSLDLSGCVIYDDVLTFSLWSDSQKIISDYYYRRDLGQRYEYELTRKSYEASVLSGDVNSVHSGRNLLVKKGAQSDSLYAWAASLDARQETFYSLVVLYKQFATITFDLSEYDSSGESFDVKVKGNYGGIDILTLDPVENVFEYEFTTNGSGLYPVRIPRQGDDALTLEVSSTGKILAEIPVGNTIRRIGYDWTSLDLNDMTVAISYENPTATVYVDVGDWTQEEQTDRI